MRVGGCLTERGELNNFLPLKRGGLFEKEGLQCNRGFTVNIITA